MNHRVPAQIEARRAAAIEQMNQRRIAQAEQRLLQSDRVIDAQRSRLLFGDRHRELVVRHDQNRSRIRRRAH